MSESVEQAVAAFLGNAEIEWEKLKPVICFVVLWNRLEERHGDNLTLGKLKARVASTATARQFDISRYEPHISFFRKRYGEAPQRLSRLLWTGHEKEVETRVDDLIGDRLTTAKDILEAVMMIPYRIRNNLFHGRKDTARLYAQTELFMHVNEVLCLFHSDLRGGS